jgi:hypothetical protein
LELASPSGTLQYFASTIWFADEGFQFFSLANSRSNSGLIPHSNFSKEKNLSATHVASVLRFDIF